MSSTVLQVGSTVRCAHGGVVTIVPTQARVTVSGQPVLLPTDPTVIVGCPQMTHGLPTPCQSVIWATMVSRVWVQGQPLLQADGVGITQPHGTPVLVVASQGRVRAG